MRINSPNYLNNDVSEKRADESFFFQGSGMTFNGKLADIIDARELIKRNDCDKKIRRTQCITTNGIEIVPFVERFSGVNAMQFVVQIRKIS